MTVSTETTDLRTARPTGLVTAAVLIEDGKVFLVRRGKDVEAYAGLWDLPQVHMPGDESPEDGFVTGLSTDFGIEVNAFRLLTVQDDCHQGVFYRRFVYRVDAFTGELTTRDTVRSYGEKEFRDVFQLNPLVLSMPLFNL